MIKGLFRVILPVACIDKASAFYSAMFDEPGERVSPGRHYFQCGGTVLALYDPKADGDEIGAGWSMHENQYFYFSVSDLESIFERAKDAGADIQGDIEAMPWGERLFYANDPFGNPICFVDEETLFMGTA
ncbi:VOC family protein [Kordiimonas aquimaris]|uniref:VOC family protein n=1 Tax=Kordiimonas aquimaris TaxID=707591 RepID=UPI0021CF881E|nr:VOC family protein [Kordiimonas aquimaris]